MRTPLSVVAASLGLSFLLLSPAIARPVASADLSGKKICWNDGDVQTYYPGGKYSSPQNGDGTWAVTAAGVEFKAQDATWSADIEKLADGTFTGDIALIGRTKHSIGHYCK
jgi:hypothetical protein